MQSGQVEAGHILVEAWRQDPSGRGPGEASTVDESHADGREYSVEKRKTGTVIEARQITTEQWSGGHHVGGDTTLSKNHPG